MHTRNWLVDFELTPRGVVVKKTRIRVPVNAGVLRATAAWFEYFFAIQARRAEPRFTVAFLPERARPWYLIWPVLRLAGGRFVDDPAKADLVIAFEDAAISVPIIPPATKPGARLLNVNATDVTKSAVASAFERTFGYPLALDPRTHVGPAVEKGEANGVHDGRIIDCPAEPRPGRVYQRVVDNRGRRGLVEDLRAPTIGGRPICVFVKRRPIGQRFTNDNAEVELARPEDLFSPVELERIGAYCRSLGLDWGGLDVLRDAQDGRIYIVDANKTDMGPPTALPLADKLRATELLAEALLQQLGFAGARR